MTVARPDGEDPKADLVGKAKAEAGAFLQGQAGQFFGGLLAASPFSAVVGDAATAVVGVVGGVAIYASRKWRERSERIAQLAASARGQTTADLARELTSSSEKLDLFIHVVDAAARARLDSKIRALSLALVMGLDDSARLDETYLLVDALDALEASHVRLMSGMANHLIEMAPLYANREDDVTYRGINRPELESKFPQFAHVLQPLLSTLIRYGLIFDPHEGRSVLGSSVHWKLTPLGENCLDLLDAAPTG